MIDVVEFTVIDNVEDDVVCVQKTAGDLSPFGQR
jgi:hypothetical protein